MDLGLERASDGMKGNAKLKALEPHGKGRRQRRLVQ